MEKTTHIIAASFIDGTGNAMRKKVFLTCKQGIITAINSIADLPDTDGTTVYDFSHCTIVPALIDCSMSLSRSPSVDSLTQSTFFEADPSDRQAMLERHINYCHAHGVLGIAASDNFSGSADVLRKISAESRLAEIRSAGTDFLRLNYSPDIDNDTGPFRQLHSDDLRCILQHRELKNTVVVANGRQQVSEALAAGCDAVEQGYGMGEDNLRKMADNNILWIPSVLRAKNSLDGSASGGDVCCRFSTRYVAPGKAVPGAEDFWKRILTEQLNQLRIARSLGVKTAVGTGAGSVGILHGESMVEEMKLFIKAGYSLAETICCASENAASFFGMEKLGALTVGRRATFLITRGTPQQLPRKLAYLEGIYVDGAPSTRYRKNPARAV